ncbi:DUF2255 family protein [Arthrobacter sp. CC3]|uniref:DUF2255 family protein n=1 Tax=Arthrobacter sp. CC3 TaxID=3029185 RepID=UPI0032636A5D
MTAWNDIELSSMAAADDLHISPFREDGITYGTPTWIWSVVVAGQLYVRAYNGQNSRWYRSAMRQKAGRIRIAGTDHKVRFTPAADDVLGEVDTAYRAKYGTNNPYLPPMLRTGPRSATVLISPRN